MAKILYMRILNYEIEVTHLTEKHFIFLELFKKSILDIQAADDTAKACEFPIYDYSKLSRDEVLQIAYDDIRIKIKNLKTTSTAYNEVVAGSYERKYGGDFIATVKPTKFFLSVLNNTDKAIYRVVYYLLFYRLNRPITILLYEWIRQVKPTYEPKTINVSTSDLKSALGVESQKYTQPSNFKRLVLDKLVEEINKNTDLFVEYKDLSSLSKKNVMKNVGFEFTFFIRR